MQSCREYINGTYFAIMQIAGGSTFPISEDRRLWVWLWVGVEKKDCVSVWFISCLQIAIQVLLLKFLRSSVCDIVILQYQVVFFSFCISLIAKRRSVLNYLKWEKCWLLPFVKVLHLVIIRLETVTQQGLHPQYAVILFFTWE